eukprot:scaffold191710_cov20-Tisochrysis_lutea.AAC.1
MQPHTGLCSNHAEVGSVLRERVASVRPCTSYLIMFQGAHTEGSIEMLACLATCTICARSYKPRGKNAKADAERERSRTTAARSPEVPARGVAPVSPRGRLTGRAGATRKVRNEGLCLGAGGVSGGGCLHLRPCLPGLGSRAKLARRARGVGGARGCGPRVVTECLECRHTGYVSAKVKGLSGCMLSEMNVSLLLGCAGARHWHPPHPKAMMTAL